MTTLLGTTLNGRYRLEARIGSGGMSTVYRALDGTLQRQVAIKLMNREVATDSDQLERFRREARAVAQLSHPHIVGVIDAGEDEGRPYIVFEYVEGETLKDRIRRQGRLPVAEAVAYAIEVARARGAARGRVRRAAQGGRGPHAPRHRSRAHRGAEGPEGRVGRHRLRDGLRP